MIMINIYVYIVSVLSAVGLTALFFHLKREKTFINNYEKIVDSIHRVNKELETLEHRINLNVKNREIE